MFVTIWRQVGATTGKAKAQRGPRTYTDAGLPRGRRVSEPRADGDCGLRSDGPDRYESRSIHRSIEHKILECQIIFKFLSNVSIKKLSQPNIR